MTIKSIQLLALAAISVWVFQTAGPDTIPLMTPGHSTGALVLAGLGLMVTIARRRFK